MQHISAHFGEVAVNAQALSAEHVQAWQDLGHLNQAESSLANPALQCGEHDRAANGRAHVKRNDRTPKILEWLSETMVYNPIFMRCYAAVGQYSQFSHNCIICSIRFLLKLYAVVGNFLNFIPRKSRASGKLSWRGSRVQHQHFRVKWFILTRSFENASVHFEAA